MVASERRFARTALQRGLCAIALLLPLLALATTSDATATPSRNPAPLLDLSSGTAVDQTTLAPANERLVSQAAWASVVQVDDAVRHALAAPAATPAVTVVLPDGTNITFDRHALHAATTNSVVWFGLSPNGATLAATTTNGLLGIAIQTHDQTIGLRAAGTQHLAYVIDGLGDQTGSAPGATTAGLPHTDAVAPTDLGLVESLDTSPPPTRNGPAVIDVAVYYDTATVNFWGGEQAARNAIVASVDAANVFLDRSGLAKPVSFRLALLKRVNYTGSGNDSVELSRLTSATDGRLDFVHTERNNNKIDLVTLVTPITGCGIAFALGNRGGSQHLGFSVVDPNCLGEGRVTYAHELGHNLGAAHDPPNASNGVFFPNGYGYVDRTAGVVTIMAYLPADRCCSYLGRFSNPNITYQGRPMGTAGHHNAKVINDNALVVSRYRTGAPTTPRAVTASAGNLSATVRWQPPVSDRGWAVTQYTVTASPGGRSCTTSGGLRSCTVTGLTGGTNYTFTVKAKNSQGTSAGATATARPNGNAGNGGGGGNTNGTSFVAVSGNPAGWVVTGGTKQWISASCRQQLSAAGASFSTVTYNSISNTPNTTNNRTCNELQTLIGGGGGNTGFGVQFVTTARSIEGFAMFAGEKQWVSAACRRQLEAAGATFGVVPYSSVSSTPNSATTRTCTELQNFVFQSSPR